MPIFFSSKLAKNSLISKDYVKFKIFEKIAYLFHFYLEDCNNFELIPTTSNNDYYCN